MKLLPPVVLCSISHWPLLQHRSDIYPRVDNSWIMHVLNTPSIPSALSSGHCRLSALLSPAAVPGTISHSFSHSPSSTTSTEPFTVQFMNAPFLFWPALRVLPTQFIFILPAEFRSCLTKICKSLLIQSTGTADGGSSIRTLTFPFPVTKSTWCALYSLIS